METKARQYVVVPLYGKVETSKVTKRPVGQCLVLFFTKKGNEALERQPIEMSGERIHFLTYVARIMAVLRYRSADLSDMLSRHFQRIHSQTTHRLGVQFDAVWKSTGHEVM